MKLNDYFAIATIEYYNESQNDTFVENQVLTNVSSYTEAVAMLEEYYGNDLESIQQMTLLEGPFLNVSNETIDKIMKEEI